MRAEHLAIDGAVVSIDADADLSTKTTAAGWAIVPSLMQAHPFNVFPAGHSRTMEESARSFPDVHVRHTENYTIKDNQLRVAEIEMPAATGGTNKLTVGAWDGPAGCLYTSIYGFDRQRMVEIFDTLQFSVRSRGLVIDSRVVAEPRPPEIIKEVPEIGILKIRPAVASELERIPKSRGFAADHGELFRVTEKSRDLLFVGASTVTTVKTSAKVDPERALSTARHLRIEWTPRGSITSQ